MQEQQEQEQTEAVQQADDIRTREEEIAEVFLSLAEVGVTREQGVQTEERIREGRGTADSSRGGLDRHCRSQ